MVTEEAVLEVRMAPIDPENPADFLHRPENVALCAARILESLFQRMDEGRDAIDLREMGHAMAIFRGSDDAILAARNFLARFRGLCLTLSTEDERDLSQHRMANCPETFTIECSV